MDAQVDQVKKRKKKRERHSIRNTYFFNRILQATLGRWLKKTFQAYLETPDFFKNIKPPYILIANHNCFWGPFINAAFVPDPVHYIVSDSNFRNPLTNLFLSMVGSIPKTKAMTDMETLKHIIDIKNKNGVIGLYPEGQNSYDGHCLPIPHATGKLLKHLSIPVILAQKYGAYLSYPRWAKSIRSGAVPISFSLAFSVDELKTMSPDAVYERLETLLYHDEIEWQRESMVLFKGKDRAEYLEILLFVCPHCKAISTMRSEGDVFACTACGYTVRLNEYYFFETKADRLYHDNLRDWNVWQLGFLKEHFRGLVPTMEFLMQEDEILLHTGYKIEPLRHRGHGRLRLNSENLEFLETNGMVHAFPLTDIKGINMHNNEMLEFYFKNTLYNFSSRNKRTSLYKWYNAVVTVRELKGMV